MGSMGATGEKRRDGPSNKDRKVSKTGNKKAVGKSDHGARSMEAVKEAVPAVLKLRLFVGGLGPAVGAADLQQRFAPLGTVHKIDLVERRDGWDAEEALQRGFAYVDFEASSEASLRKLFSAYNGCKWKGGVLRVEKAKEHYMDRLRREWTEAEAEAAAKAKIAEKAAANAISQSRPMYSSQCEDVWGSPGSNGVEPEDAIGEEGDADEMAVDADEIAAQIEKERRKQLDLFSKLFPEDIDAGDEEEKVIEIAKLRAFPMAADGNAKKRKHGLENPSERVPVASSIVQTNVEESGVARVLKPPMDVNDRQVAKNRRVKFSEDADARPFESLNEGSVATESQRKDSFDAGKGVRPILKKTLSGVNPEMDVDRGEGEEEEEEEYYLSSRSPSPEGGLSDESKWERLFKHAGLKKGPEVAKRSAGVASAANPRLSMWTGISLDDDDDAEPAVAVIESPHRDAAASGGLSSGVLSEQEDEESDPPQQTTLAANAADGVSLDAVGSDGIFSGILSDLEEADEDEEDDIDSPQPSMLASKAEDSVALKKSKKMIEEPKTSLNAPSDQGDESSEFEDSDEGLQGTDSEEEEEDEDEDEDEDMEDFVDAASSPTPLDEAANASKWAKMFKSATNVADPAEGVFSGSLDEADKPVRARPAEKVERMFESAAANHTGSVGEAPKVSDNAVHSEVDAARQSAGEGNASISSDGTPNQDVAEAANNNTAGADEEGGAEDQQTGVMGGNLLARFNMEQDEPSHPSNPEHSVGAQASLSSAKEKVPNSIPQPEGQNVVDDNTKWMQRATWKSLMGADGRASTFSLKQVTGEPESVKPSEKPAVPEQSLNAFSFNFARNPSEAARSRPKSGNTEQAAKKPNAGSAVESKSNKPARISEDEAGCSFMKSADAEKEWRASKSELRIDSKAKHKAAVRKMKKMKGSGGAR